VKSGVVTGLAYGAAAGMGALTSVAIVPLGVFVVAVLLVGIGVNQLDTTYKVKDKIIECLKALPNNLPPGVYSAPGDMINALQSIKKAANDKMRIGSPVSDDTLREIHRFIDNSMRQMMRPR
jgi:hypothetical protein